MEEMEEKLGAILSNPQMMETIMNMAQSLSQQGQAPPEAPEPPDAPKQQPQKPPQKPPQRQPQKSASPPAPQKAFPTPPAQPPLGPKELEMIQKIAAFSRQTGLDRDQKALLKALNPYLSSGRISKLEKAMHAAKLAKFATTALDPSGLPSKFGR